MRKRDAMDLEKRENPEAPEYQEMEISEEEKISQEEGGGSEDEEILAEGDLVDEEASADTSVAVYSPLQRYLAEVRKYPFLTKEEEFQLAIQHREKGDREAAVRLILSHLKIVVSIAMEYRNAGMDLLDLIQEGNIGLMQALKKFDPYKGVRFYAYAAWWIRAYILRFMLNNWRLVKIGTTEEQRKLFFNLMKEKRRIESLGYDPEPKLIAERLQVKEKAVIEMEQRLAGSEVSLDKPLGPDSDQSLLHVLSSPDVGVDEKLAREELKTLFQEKLAQFSQSLGQRELDILRNRILAESPATLEEIGKKYRISKERARQIEGGIIKKLRKYMKKEIRDYDWLSSYNEREGVS